MLLFFFLFFLKHSLLVSTRALPVFGIIGVDKLGRYSNGERLADAEVEAAPPGRGADLDGVTLPVRGAVDGVALPVRGADVDGVAPPRREADVDRVPLPVRGVDVDGVALPVKRRTWTE